MTFRKLLVIWSLVALVAGGIGGWVGVRWFGAPFYFGFFFAFVLAGLSGLFALAAHVEGSRNRR